MRLIYADPGLLDNVGHHANACASLVKELEAREIRTRVLALEEIETGVQSETGAIPFFRNNQYWLTDGDPLCGFAYAFHVGAQSVRDDLSRLANFGTDDLLFFPWALAAQFWGTLLWMNTLPADRVPLVMINFLHVPQVACEVQDQEVQWRLPDYRLDPSPMFLRFAAKQLPKTAKGRLKLSFSNSEGVEALRAILGLDVQMLPSPQHAVSSCRRRSGAQPIVIGVLGHQRNSAKGLQHLPEVAREVLRSHPKVRFFIHSGAQQAPSELEQILMALSCDDRISIHRGPLEREAWGRMLDGVDLVLCPYSRDWYRISPSGTHNEAIANGIPSVVPAGTTLSATAEQFCGSSVTFEMSEPASIVRALRHALDNFDRYADAAHRGVKEWHEIHGPKKLVDALVAAAQQSAS